MLQLTRSQVNELAATLKDNEVSGSGTDYLFEFTSLDQAAKYVIAQVTAESTRVTQFTIELNATEDAANGVIQLRPGHYDGKVYRQDSDTNLDHLDAVVDGVIFETDAFVERSAGDSSDVFYQNSLASSIYYEKV